MSNGIECKSCRERGEDWERSKRNHLVHGCLDEIAQGMAIIKNVRMEFMKRDDERIRDNERIRDEITGDHNIVFFCKGMNVWQSEVIATSFSSPYVLVVSSVGDLK